mmetsp:Transcript_38763/g.91004  ORF Transcript_38763/g.91004 Transcript_38763/m.91004 type:complete len:341 (-) Transcript_38763:442-1464(-)
MMVTQTKFNSLIGFLRIGDIVGLQKFIPADFDWSQKGGPEDLTLLHYAVLCLGEDNPGEKHLKAMEWMLRSGADPEHELPQKHPQCYLIWKKKNKRGTTIEIPYAGHSATSLAFAWLDALEMSEEEWTVECEYLKNVVSLIARIPSLHRKKVAVAEGVVDLWESVLNMSTTHNVTLETADGNVTAHDHVLMAASPVLEAMLQSAMKEGVHKHISVTDSSGTSVALFLEVLYTSSMRGSPSHLTMLAALDLAHRWQVTTVVQQLADVLLEMITVESFVAIAAAAALKGLSSLTRACSVFGAKNPQVQAMLKKGSLPTAVRALLQPDAAKSSEAAKKKRRTV